MESIPSPLVAMPRLADTSSQHRLRISAKECKAARVHVIDHGYAVKKAPDRIIRGPQLTVATAEKVFGWKNVHKYDGELIDKKQDKAGRCRMAGVPDHSN